MLTRAAAGADEGIWLRADAQTQGRGRMGREWVSADGNVYASTIVKLRSDDPPASSLGFVAAIAVYDAIKSIAPVAGIQIKWPNDILSADGKKLCGMLLERGDHSVITGIGVNLAHMPDGLDRPVTSLRHMGVIPPMPQYFVEILAPIFAQYLADWRNQGTAAIFAAWQKRAHDMGTALSVQLPDGENVNGQYHGLEKDGALRLRLADGSIRAIHAADIFLV